MEIQINLYNVGYFAGKCCSRIIKCAGAVQVARSGFRGVTKIATKHKIDSSNVDVVSKNLFDCLRFID